MLDAYEDGEGGNNWIHALADKGEGGDGWVSAGEIEYDALMSSNEALVRCEHAHFCAWSDSRAHPPPHLAWQGSPPSLGGATCSL